MNSALNDQSIEIEKQGFNKLNSSLHYELNVSYPKVKCSGKIDLEHKINLDIQNILFMAINDFRSKISSVKAEKGAIGLSYLNLDYNVFLNDNGILSISFKKDTYYNGIDDISIKKLAYNYDVKNKRKILLNDLFLTDIDYKDQLFHLIKTELHHSGKVKKDVLNSFCIQKNGITFLLDKSKCKGKSCPDIVLVQWDKMKDILSEFGGEMLKN
ncbi:DUF4163 domain-containing protein [Flammeovirga pacifica]|uniref:DUF3298 domain-containing protein n=1 Tax=Flammeovirga pacifica TaxID=915059 RepID=A0A1S1Z576_FLAPC|nr:DUF4163 domain-containing protein [Flammeovirga pacifica]OHX68367.1 hypothetical protein NH26_19440 [Flammeovirga pacifica]